MGQFLGGSADLRNNRLEHAVNLSSKFSGCKLKVACE